MSQLDTNAIIRRIQRLREQYAGPRGKTKFAKAIGISPSTYSYYENNRIPPIETLLRISEVAGADLHWLLTGSSGSSKAKTQYGSPNAALLEHLSRLLSEHPDLAEPISTFIEILAEKKGLERQSQPEALSTHQAARPDWIPVLGRTAAGMVHFWPEISMTEPASAITELDDLVKKYLGKEISRRESGDLSVDLQAQNLSQDLRNAAATLIRIRGEDGQELVEFIEAAEIYRAFPDSFALHIDGDSMSPRINDGDIIIASPSQPARPGQIAIAKVLNQIGVACKLIRETDDTVHLIPINEHYETKVIPKKDLLWALAVLCHIKF
ncbi:MAG: S24 family peptidase [Phycisphaerales bacterium]|jgi:SOS-response transcriptional repressor LexA